MFRSGSSVTSVCVLPLPLLLLLALLAIGASSSSKMNGEFERCSLQCSSGDNGGGVPDRVHGVGLRGKAGPRGAQGQKGDMGLSCECGGVDELRDELDKVKQQLVSKCLPIIFCLVLLQNSRFGSTLRS